MNRTREISSALIPRANDQRTESREEERRMLFTQLDFVTTRSRLLQRALSRLYAALGFFVGTSVAIGLVAITSPKFALVPISCGPAEHQRFARALRPLLSLDTPEYSRGW